MKTQGYNIKKKNNKSKNKRFNTRNKNNLDGAAGRKSPDGKTHFERSAGSALLTGTIQGNERGFAFFINDDTSKPDLFIARENLNSAMNKDTVKVAQIEGRNGKGECKVVGIIKRGNRKIAGTYQSNGAFGFIIPDDKRISYDIFIAGKDGKGVKDGQKAVCEIVKYSDGRKGSSPLGAITEILGKGADTDFEILSVMHSYGLDESFPKKVEELANAVAKEPPPEELRRRLDLRGECIVTIDGADAKDLDDAVSLTINEDSTFCLGVHIADVAHYVKQNDFIDKEALQRGTSVYFPDRAIPMLPKSLSNGICSLHPKVDRLTLSIIMDIDGKGDVVAYNIAETVINTKFRLNYDEVAAALNGEKEAAEKYSKIIPLLRNMEKLCDILNEKRRRRGSIDFNIPEAKIELDRAGRVLDIKLRERLSSHRIIEEFMLLANETIAKHFNKKAVPFVYRVHENPSNEKLNALSAFVALFGFKLNPQNAGPKEMQKLLESVKGQACEDVINKVTLRSMQKAKYSPGNDGHFGLAAKYYCHFTSPIRRYPDLMIHRIIKYTLSNSGDTALEKDMKAKQRFNRIVAEASLQSSERERNAIEAEREVESLKKCEYMQRFIGEAFEGVISGVTEFGVFVALENTVEGLIRLDSLPKDVYSYNEKTYSLNGKKHKYKLGDPIRIKALASNPKTRRIDFEPDPAA
jgi:ribonuclease R